MTTDKKDQRNFPTNAMDETIRCSCTLELPDDGSVEYQSFWSDPREGQLFACTDPCIWSRECSMPNDGLKQMEGINFWSKAVPDDYVPPEPLICHQCLFVEFEPLPPLDDNGNREAYCQDPACAPETECQPEVCDGTEDAGNADIDEGFSCVLDERLQSLPKRKQRAAKQDRITTDQLTELLAIDKLIGLRGHLQRMIHALNSGGQDIDAPAEDIVINYRCEWWEVERQRQALVLWQKGIGRALGFSSYRKYIASIQEVPAHLRKGNGKFNRLLLVEGRMGLSKLCELAGVLCHCSDLQDTNKSVRWIRCQEGRKYRGHNTGVAQMNFEKREVGLNLFEGVCLYLQFPRVLSEAFAIMLTELPLSFSDCTPVNLLKITGGVGPQLYTEHVGFKGWNVGTASKLSF